ncbi:MAG: 2Fe-2S iron-sulfur cluster-binding protein [Neisseriaceae bacterium]|jgi:CDP-4-dehydro-6-deoxyglucose reductase
MSFKVSINPSKCSFVTNENNTILDAALESRINLPHGCRDGICGACKCKLVHGKIAHDKYNSALLNQHDLDDNYILLCKAKAKSNLIIDLPEFVNTSKVETVLAKIVKIDKIKDVIVLKLKLPINQQINFVAGQYLNLIYNDIKRSYSIANVPGDDGLIELHIKYHSKGVFSEILCNELGIGQLLRCQGPLGRFILKQTENPILMVCTGTGFAPLKSMLEQLVLQQSKRKIHFVWGNRATENFYLTEMLNEWRQQLNITFTLCISQDEGAEFYSGRVTKYIENTFNDLTDYEVYACGSGEMVEDLYKITTKKLLKKTSFYSDVFSISSV